MTYNFNNVYFCEVVSRGAVFPFFLVKKTKSSKFLRK